MQKSQRLRVTLFALSILLILHGPQPANGQGSQQGFPVFHVQGSAQSSAVGLTPAQIKRAYGFDKIVNQGKGQVIAIVDAFDDPNEDGHFVGSNVTFFAAAGDSGKGTLYPAASPYVMSVGGTTLNVDQFGNYLGEKAWSGSGGGLSPYEPEPLYQIAYPIPSDSKRLRGTPDVAYNGDPNTGVAIYDSVPYLGQTGWFQVGGTSSGAPQWAGLIAIADSMRHSQKQPALTGSLGVLYDAAKEADDNYHDIISGTRAKVGYDYSTGLGTPKADGLILSLSTLR
jgi:subtilase family serine protease